MRQKRVVYLFGAGATQGEISFVDNSVFLLTSEIVAGMIKKIDTKNLKALNEVKNELTVKSDVEHLITLYDNIGTAKHARVARGLKELFRQEILDRFKLFESRNKSFSPTLTSALVDMHQVGGFNEQLAGIITLNYDDIAERAIHRVKNKVDYSIIARSDKWSIFTLTDSGDFSLIKLHGSFNWKRDYPILVTNPSRIKQHDVLWLPPGVEKKRDFYPFNALWSSAREMLRCDIVRIIGCSLNRNDIHLISLLFSMQKINNKNFTIELIDFKEIGDKVRENYPYLRTTTILEIAEFKKYLVEFMGVKEDSDGQSLNEFVSRSNTRLNIFERWLRAKGSQVKKASSVKSISTPSGIFEKFINERE